MMSERKALASNEWRKKRTCHMRSVCPGTACRTGISARKQKISKFIRAQWESHELKCMDDERRQILEEAAELDHI